MISQAVVPEAEGEQLVQSSLQRNTRMLPMLARPRRSRWSSDHCKALFFRSSKKPKPQPPQINLSLENDLRSQLKLPLQLISLPSDRFKKRYIDRLPLLFPLPSIQRMVSTMHRTMCIYRENKHILSTSRWKKAARVIDKLMLGCNLTEGAQMNMNRWIKL